MGAFKFRGAFNALSKFDDQQRRAGVLAFSSVPLRRHRPYRDPKTIADGAQTQHLGSYTFPVIRRDVDDVLTDLRPRIARERAPAIPTTTIS